MSRRKGISLDEKRFRMLQLFYEKKEFFNLKELERIAPKEKGIVLQSVKDIVQALVDDDLVKSDKIGTSIYYWAFPGQNITAIEQRIANASKQVVEAEFKLQKLNEACQKEKVGKEDTKELQDLMQELSELKQKEIDLLNQLKELNDADPEAVTRLNKKAMMYKNAANTWTDNIFTTQSWCKDKFAISTEDLNKHFNIPDNLDYLE